jgi:L-aspartate oxidase
MDIDLLVIGTGVAGCTAALQAADRGQRVTILTSADDPLASNSFWAQVRRKFVLLPHGVVAKTNL